MNDKDRTIRISNEDHLVVKTISTHTSIPMKEILHQSVGLLGDKYTELEDFFPKDFEIIRGDYGKAEKDTNH